MLDRECMQRAQVTPVAKKRIVSWMDRRGVGTGLQIIIEDRAQRAIALRERLTEPRSIGEGREVQHVEGGQQSAVLVVGPAQIHDLAHGRVRIPPRRVIHRGIV